MRRAFRLALVLSAFTLVAPAAGCTSILGTVDVVGDDGSVDASGGGKTDTTIEASTDDGGVSTDDGGASTDDGGDAYAGDSGNSNDASGGDSGQTGDSGGGDASGCGAALDPGAGVFVAPGGGTGACGSETQPCATIAAGLNAIATAKGSKTILYLANGTYTEQVTLPAGVHVIGGWLDTGGTWTPQCTNPSAGAIIQAPAGASTTVVASYSGTSTLDTLTIQSVSSAASGESLFGITASGSSTVLNLTNVDVSVASGGAGVSGSTGSAGTNGTGTCTTVGTGSVGSPGTNGVGAAPGSYSASGYSPQSGTTGTGGGTGDYGAQPAAATCTNIDNPCIDDGSGTGACIDQNPYSCCNTAGRCGNPGTGSGPGTPGSGGGSSIGIFVVGATVNVTSGALAPGGGGNGGNGGAGGMPGQGSYGGSGTAGKYATMCGPYCHTVGGQQVCYCKGNNSVVCQAAGLGTYGGNGGQGGQAGGGSGGDSYCWYILSGSGGVVNAGSAACTPQTAGLGGSQGISGVQGANGKAGAHN